MSLIGNISDVPLYTTIQEALNWASANGLEGYHTHTFTSQGVYTMSQIGYMGGYTHNEATDPPLVTNPNTNSPLPPVQPLPVQPPTTIVGGSSGGGY